MATAEDYALCGRWANMKEPDKNIDRRNSTRTVPMEVLSLGMPRTATLSMNEALRILGYADPYHFANILENIRDCDMWCDALNAKFKGKGRFCKKEFDQLLGHCAGVTDVPCIMFWEELHAYYPEAKIVLVERDTENWSRSMSILIRGLLDDKLSRYVLQYTDPFWWGRVFGLSNLYLGILFGSHDPNQAEANAISAYQKHYANVRATIPKEQLLEYHLGSGWGPLCEFLGKPIPDLPFPHQNEAEALRNSLGVAAKKAIWNSSVNVLAVLGGVGVLGGVVSWYMRRV